MLLEQEQFAGLSAHDPGLFASLQRLEPAERRALITYLKSQVPLQHFDIAA
jgi:hypothetical protein